MKFNSLEDAEKAYNELAGSLAAMQSMQVAVSMVITALIAKHHDYDQLQLLITSFLERSDVGNLSMLSDNQRHAVRAYVEHLQRIYEAKGKIDPLR